MGAIIEFLLIRYCENHNIEPEPINNRKSNSFANYVEAAIKNDIFGEKISEVDNIYENGFSDCPFITQCKLPINDCCKLLRYKQCPDYINRSNNLKSRPLF